MGFTLAEGHLSFGLGQRTEERQTHGTLPQRQRSAGGRTEHSLQDTGANVHLYGRRTVQL